ncbi:TetR/AcrR family transcriptional regulator [Motilibacter deserti]|uniref:TetR/AcrR family transcriptional regulator n=1 Tax=Motilibacter deserti TaxID=2714956 RepID=A0ABX0GUC8_9ACTN|nr:TetR/AcrR family transcriptional regulator [Motilibacter deserti]
MEPGSARQDAPRDTRAAIVEAATLLLRESGARAVTTRAVAQAAQVQAPTIYRLFGDKDGLLDAVAEHVMSAYVAAKPGDGLIDDPVEELRAAWRAHVEFGLSNPEVYALLTTPGRGAPSPATAAGIDVLRSRVRRLAQRALLKVDEERAVLLIHAAGTGAVLALLDEPAEERDLGLADFMLDAVLARMLVSAPAVADDDVAAVAVTFATVVPDLPGLSSAERMLLSEWVSRSLRHLRGRSAAATPEE